jgi:hypothetical protein
MRRVGWKLKAGAVGFLFVIALAAPAFAVGSFDWTVDFTVKLSSRTYTTTAAGNHSIRSNMTTCSGPTSSYTIEVVRERTFGDAFFGKKTYSCGVNQTKTWSTDARGNYHFDLEKANNGFHFKGSGTTTYPSS